MDHQIDVLATPDASTVRIKDRDDFDEALALGLRSQTEHAAVEAAADAAVAFLKSEGAELHERWSAWVPDPTWTVSPLPAGLD